MDRQTLLVGVPLLASIIASNAGHAAPAPTPSKGTASKTATAILNARYHNAKAIRERMNRRPTMEQREAAAMRARAAAAMVPRALVPGAMVPGARVPRVFVPRSTVPGSAGTAQAGTQGVASNLILPPGYVPPAQGGTPNYFGPEPNWAFSPPLRKFVDSLPGLGATNANNLGQYIPVAHPDTISYPGCDYYEISLVQYSERMHSDLKPTLLRGYVQTNTGTDVNSQNTIPPDPVHYLGPMILARKGRPVRVKFTNALPTGAGGDLFLPVDTTMMGAGMGPLGMSPLPGTPMNYSQNRGVIHLHGGKTPWISDGTPHQWITPAGEVTSYPKGVSVQNVPDMPDPGPGSMTFFYSNQQSARLMFYHDHALGITRLNVYAGEAAGYLLTDDYEQDLVNGTNSTGINPSGAKPLALDQIPLIIQDKTFVDPNTVLATDPTWPFAVDPNASSLWLPHVYMTNQNPNDLMGMNALGRWDYGPWFWPLWPATNGPKTITDPVTGNSLEVPGVPDLSESMEAFHDTPVINGTAYPYLDVQPKAYRFRILNAANDRFWNLGLYVADPLASTEVRTVTAAPGATYPAGWTDANGNPIPTGTPIAFPDAWKAQTLGQPGDILDGRASGVPDPMLLGPSMIQIGTEGGFLPAPVELTNIPIGFDRDPKSVTVGNVKEHNLFLGPAERADVIVDFSAYAGKTLIVYNDSPAPVPATDSRVDYYTGDADQTGTGGTATTPAGFGPNTRTILQIRVAPASPAPTYDTAPLYAAFATDPATGRPGVFAASQDPILVPQAPYNSAYNKSFPADKSAYAQIQTTQMTFTPLNAANPVTVTFTPKAIAEEFETEYGRMSAFLGVELPFTNGINQTTIFYNYFDPATENINDSVTPAAPSVTPMGTLADGTQIWKVTHNGVDTHPIHFHLFDVQIINRIGWDNTIRPPDPNELGWKETVRMNPLEDCIVALRPTAPALPFGLPDSKRPLDPTMPIGSTTSGFKNVDPITGNPITPQLTNQVVNFGWEYVWHCHILSHEEMDMMRPVIFNVARALAAVPVASVTQNGAVNLSWTDGTPYSYDARFGGVPLAANDPKSEIGFRIERALVSQTTGLPGTYAAIGTALANHTSFADVPPSMSITSYAYRVVAYNAAGETTSSPVLAGAPIPINAPTGLTATLQSASTVKLQFSDNSLDETGFNVERSVDGGRTFVLIQTLPASKRTGLVSTTDTTLVPGNSYVYRVAAVKGIAVSAYTNAVTVSVPTPPAPPSNVTVTAVRAGGNNDTVTLKWIDNATNETSYTVQRASNATFTSGLVTTTLAANATTLSQTVSRGTTCYYRVYASNISGPSAAVNAAPFPIVTP